VCYCVIQAYVVVVLMLSVSCVHYCHHICVKQRLAYCTVAVTTLS